MHFRTKHILCDNTSEINLTNPILHSKAKHIDIRNHFIHEHVNNDDINIKYIHTKEHLVDIFTKPLEKSIFKYLRNEISICFPFNSKNVNIILLIVC